MVRWRGCSDDFRILCLRSGIALGEYLTQAHVNLGHVDQRGDAVRAVRAATVSKETTWRQARSSGSTPTRASASLRPTTAAATCSPISRRSAPAGSAVSTRTSASASRSLKARRAHRPPISSPSGYTPVAAARRTAATGQSVAAYSWVNPLSAGRRRRRRAGTRLASSPRRRHTPTTPASTGSGRTNGVSGM